MALGVQEISPLVKDLFPWVVDRRALDVIDDVEQAITDLWQFSRSYQTLSREGLSGLSLSLLLDLITAGLGEIGINLNVGDVIGPKSTLLNLLLSELSPYIDALVTELFDDLAPSDITIDVETLRQAFNTFVKWFTQGKAVANSPRAVRRPRRTADPVSLYRGEFERVVSDLQVIGAGLDFDFRRTYRSRAAVLGALGPCWDHSYNLRLRRESPFMLRLLTGGMSERRFFQHPRYGDTSFSYYIPPRRRARRPRVGRWELLPPAAAAGDHLPLRAGARTRRPPGPARRGPLRQLSGVPLQRRRGPLDPGPGQLLRPLGRLRV
jgi:hypothetical protein